MCFIQDDVVICSLNFGRQLFLALIYITNNMFKSYHLNILKIFMHELICTTQRF